MIYFECYQKGYIGFNNQLISYTLCISLSNFLQREFFFDFDVPSATPPDYAVQNKLKQKFEILLKSKRSLVSDLVSIPVRRCFEIDRTAKNKVRYENILERFMTTDEQKSQFENTIIWDSFSLARQPLVKEELQNFDLIEIGEANLVNVSYFYFLNKTEKTEILDSVKIRYADDIEKLAGKIRDEVSAFNAIHIRLGDFTIAYQGEGYDVKIERFRKYLEANISDKSLPILVATDALQEKELFAEILKGYKYIFIDELIFDEYSKEFSELQFTDFNVLSILNQLLCADSENFIGTARSTFTGIIHRLRQERFGKTDFNFHPDDRINKLLSADYKIQHDRNGFFDWNKYSVFSEYFSDPGWMREWNYDLTALNIKSYK
jgi:GDP-fucose protein O-fucosyltransferase